MFKIHFEKLTGPMPRAKLEPGDLGQIRVEYDRVARWAAVADAAWGRGFSLGALVGMIVTTALLGGAIAFLIFIDWLGKCA